MKEKTVKSPYGIWTVIYEVKSGGRTFWFNEAEIDSAEKNGAQGAAQSSHFNAE